MSAAATVDEKEQRRTVCVTYREVVGLGAGEEAFTGTRTGVTRSTGLQAEKTVGFCLLVMTKTHTERQTVIGEK